MRKLKDKSVMVTGGAQGIGEGIARRLASEGASIAVADLNGEKAKALAEELRSEGANAIGVKVDVGERSQVQAAIKRSSLVSAGSTSCSTTPASTSRCLSSTSTRAILIASCASTAGA